ncbi:histone-lysine N-methyltransferase ATX2-like [Primulina eburnea]|uniref:histone-lysine N-methyltransferase ATX2-like n=1 Tax=Primulina eburnea TaxID=1245227 RepID=UPI003C6C3931
MVAAFPTSNVSPAAAEEKHGVKLNAPPLEEHDEDEFQRGKTPLKYMTLCEVYSATSPCVSASGLKKVKAASRKPPQPEMEDSDQLRMVVIKPAVTRVYSRQKKRKEMSFLEMELSEGGLSGTPEVEEGGGKSVVKRRKDGSSPELTKLGVDCEGLSNLDVCHNVDKIKCPSVEKDTNPNTSVVDRKSKKRKNGPDVLSKSVLKKSGGVETKKWVWLSFEGIDPKKVTGLQCKVYWPLDARWYSGRVLGYNLEAGRHHVKYEDEEEENLILANERVKFYVSHEEMQSLELRCLENSSETDPIDVNEMMVLAASLDDCQDVDCGDIIWAKLTGHAVWPAIVLDESQVGTRKGLNKTSGEKSVLVQFFGTYDFARVTKKQVISFLKGLLSSCHLKCKKPAFARALEEAKMYLSEQKLPKEMLQLRDDGESREADNNDSGSGEQDDGADSGDEECLCHEEMSRKLEDLKSCQLESGELQVISLGKLVKETDNFRNERFIWPEGYTAMRKFPSIADPSVCVLYKMQVLRDVDSRTRPLFRVTTDDEEEFNGSTPSACWNKIYERVKKVRTSISDHKAAVETEHSCKSGSFMFGLSHPKVSKLIQEMSNSRQKSKSSQSASKRTKGGSSGYRSVHVEWRDLDKCNVCHMDEEYESNLFLQCDKCRMMVHARCYGELEPTDGALWLCNLCRPGAPELPPPCCLCPIIGGAMKPTTDGEWAHLACAIWIPETCLSDIKKMEPIDGIHRIHKDRWKLLCSICGVPYGACIQCSNSTCRVAYHPLCARVAGFCVEPEDVDRLHFIPFDEDEEDQCIQLFSFCKKHRPLSNEPLLDERIGQQACECGDYTPPSNPSGCARTEPYSSLKRRGRNEPEVLASASSKRLYLENSPYLVGGYSPHMPFRNKSSCALDGSKYTVDLQKLQMHQLDPSSEMLLVSDKYKFMRDTFRKRLAFGKSRIHGFGVFTKCPHRAGDMIVEYTGEIIRPSVADKRELSIYNSLVGAGTYMFRVDDERVVDATRAGSIAHLINHSCEPNCYSRTISINGNDHIIIFAKRDIKQWEELTYDYRFASKDQRLACYCGFPRCRGVVNDAESVEREKGLYVPPSELKDWEGE